MNKQLEAVLGLAAKTMADWDLSHSRVTVNGSQFFIGGEPVEPSVNVPACLEILLAVDPEHDIGGILAARLQIALLLTDARKKAEQREALRLVLNAPGAEHKPEKIKI